ncbi:MAG: hypothetical protein ACRDUS_01155 [Mycobacterium sp.]
MTVVGVGLVSAAPAFAIPPVEKVACGALDAAQQHNNAIGDDIGNMRTTLQDVLVQGGKIQGINNASILVNRDIRALKGDAAGIGDKGMVDAVNALEAAAQDMTQSVNGLYGGNYGYGATGVAIPSADTYGFVDTAGDKQLAVAAVLNELRAKGCA